ncbi:tRNA (guanosine(46)-N7)-methyltransferase TrmB [Acidihalobacter yilgarnensis]|uniref:tRNA (guanine-N(7)-)-methyltransferase n=1 Tax=Acidihalobacter yilgarnensis TaxID=2819280 RepID=A0A1D8IRJ7_9GAMM|nr:tRNA (guanosine(46)-N7)-methyltransferase TrmB [Acidihalobacter yilgarnensis]AOU99086.1 tRNA (guanosine(46)-N7)-methyltransferase TrmB [Acidihalobacter yilgarnensis]
MTDTTTIRRIRSFVRREGRLTRGQQRAIDTLGPRYLLDAEDPPLSLPDLFGRTAPVTLEIGFGDGESLADQATRHPERDYIGIEVHRPGIGHLLQLVERDGLTNVRLFCADAVEVLERRIPDAALATVQIFFPDPWHKKRHHKRRLVQPAFVARLARKLAVGGHLHLATDWAEYAEHMLEVMESTPDFVNAHGPVAWAPGPGDRPETKFERRGQRLGHDVWDLVYLKN